MIDLHMHTTYSDGSNSVIEILKLCEEKNLSVISITDHNTCDAYFELEKISNLKEIFSGHIITGVELKTIAAGVPIEILAYNFDYKIMQELIQENYIDSEEYNRIEFKRLIKKCNDEGIILDENVYEQFDPNNFATVAILRNINNHKENFKKLNAKSLKSVGDFYREYTSNPNSQLFVNNDDLLPDLNTIIDIIKQSGGLVFVPHIYEYRSNTPKVLDALIKNGRIDGFECYYSTFTKEQHEYILDFTIKHNLLISGGSDYHGKVKPTISIGVGHGDLNIPDSIQENWAKYIY